MPSQKHCCLNGLQQEENASDIHHKCGSPTNGKLVCTNIIRLHGEYKPLCSQDKAACSVVVKEKRKKYAT